MTKKYMPSIGRIPEIFEKIRQGTAPEKFTAEHLRGLGFRSSNDRAVIGLLKDLGFLTPDGTPTQRYLAYRDASKSRQVLGSALREAYADLFHINENPTERDREAIEGKFKAVHNTTDRVAEEQARTFFALLKLADIELAPAIELPGQDGEKEAREEEARPEGKPGKYLGSFDAFTGFRYNIEIHLPPTKDPDVYAAIFKSLKEHLIDD